MPPSSTRAIPGTALRASASAVRTALDETGDPQRLSDSAVMAPLLPCIVLIHLKWQLSLKFGIKPQMVVEVLLREHRPCGCGWRGRRVRNVECQPDVPARGPIRRIEFAIAFQVEIALPLVADRKDVTDLRTDSEHP